MSVCVRVRVYMCVRVHSRAAVGVLICVNATAAGNPLHDFTIIPTTLASVNTTSDPFHPDFLAHMAGSTIINFAPWLKTENGNK